MKLVFVFVFFILFFLLFLILLILLFLALVTMIQATMCPIPSERITTQAILQSNEIINIKYQTDKILEATLINVAEPPQVNYIYTYIYVYTYMFVYVNVYVCMFVNLHVYLHVYARFYWLL
jgi:hypothetical protein